MRALGTAAVAATALLALPAGADAAGARGIVVDKDVARGTVAAATRAGEVRTFRLPAPAVRRARIGQRVTLAGTRLADGTYRAKRLAGRGRSARTSVRGAVVAVQGRRLVLSTGETVLTATTSRSRRARAASAHAIEAGDLVVADVTVGADGLRITDVRDLGDASVLELEGIVLGYSDGSLRLAVARRGEVSMTVPDGVLPLPPAAGDQVEVAVSVAEDGSLTLLALDVEDDDRDDDHGLEVDDDHAEIEAEGVIEALTSDSISVRVSTQTITCAIPAGADLSAFAVGDEVEAKCRIVDGAFVLRKLESERVEFKVTDGGGFKLEVDDERDEHPVDNSRGDGDADEGDEPDEDDKSDDDEDSDVEDDR